MKTENKKCGEIFWCGPGKFVFSCVYCTKTFDSKQNALDHIDKHFFLDGLANSNDNNEKESLPSYKVEMTFSDEESVKAEIDDPDPLADPLLEVLNLPDDIKEEPKVEEIPLQQASKVGVPKKKRIHKIVQCDICKKSMKKPTLYDHFKIHSGQKLFSCHVCGARFRTKSFLGSHFIIHTGEKRHKCSVCNYKTAHSKALVYHMRTHTGEKPYKCTICNSFFARSNSLTQHNRNVHENVRPHKCKLCDNSYKVLDKLRLHMRTHTGERPYCCDVCGRTFTRANIHKQHMILHSGEKPLKCRFCDLAFAQYAGRRIHERSVHNSKKNEQF